MGEATDKLKAAGNKLAGNVKEGIGKATGNASHKVHSPEKCSAENMELAGFILITLFSLAGHTALEQQFAKQQNQNEDEQRLPNFLPKPPRVIERAVILHAAHEVGL